MLKKRKIVIANWKMNVFTLAEAKKIISSVKKKVLKVKNVDVVFGTPFVHLGGLKDLSSKIVSIGAQNVSSEEKGSFTGEVSVMHLKDYKVKFCIVGHSERRKMGETDEMINKKLKLCLREKITPILCVGEWQRDENGEYLELVKNQIKNSLSGVSRGEIANVIVAYEPVWAIGTGSAMDSKDVHEMYLYIKKCLKEIFNSYSENVRVIYGGSADSTNAKDILVNGNVDGFLVGKASLDADNFSGIIKSIN